MSVKVMSLVWEHAPCRENSLIVLLALADWANDEGISWPSIQKLADKARVDRRSAQRIIRRLQHEKLITLEEGGGRAKQHRFKIETAALCRPLAEINSGVGDTKTAALGTERAALETQKAALVSPDPLVEPLVHTSVERSDFITELKANATYSRLDVDSEYGRALAWAGANRRQVTKRFFVNWLNRSLENLPIETNGNGRVHDAAWHARQAEIARRMGRVYRPDAS